MKKIVTICAAIIALASCNPAQEVKHLSPSRVEPMPHVDLREMASAWALMDSIGYDSLPERQQGLIDLMEADEVLGHFYSPACSWYCGARIDTVVASSYMPSDGEQSYIGMNAHDWSIQSAWLAGASEHGASLTYTFPADLPRITAVLVLNGYVRTPDDWRAYARVKELKVYYDGKPYAVLDLQDTNGLQRFDVGELGFRDGERDTPWTLRFEVLDVYPGEKFPNAAITELYFDGIDVH